MDEEGLPRGSVWSLRVKPILDILGSVLRGGVPMRFEDREHYIFQQHTSRCMVVASSMVRSQATLFLKPSGHLQVVLKLPKPQIREEAARIVCWAYNGAPPSTNHRDAYEVHHTCHNPRCLNPSHLEWLLATIHREQHGEDNNGKKADMHAKMSAWRAAKAAKGR